MSAPDSSDSGDGHKHRLALSCSMNEHALHVLEYDKIITMVAGYAVSEPGRSVVQGLTPAPDQETVTRRLEETRECMRIILAGSEPPLSGIKDIRPQLEKVRAEGVTLSPDELLDISSTIAAGRRVRAFFLRSGGAGPAAPLLVKKAETIVPLGEVEDAILSAIDEQAGVRDSASPGLRKIRKQLARLRGEIIQQLDALIRDPRCGKVVQEPVITLREDRYVLPLKPNFRQEIGGIVHGRSGSQATLFVEPLDVLDQNNRLAELRIEEREEIRRILQELTRLVASEAGSLRITLSALAEIDCICARARFGLEYQASVADISNIGRVRLRAARHPLLLKRAREHGTDPAVMPNDISLGDGQRLLIVSGPNAGGKTVVLKTTGLLCLMSQAGLPVTASEGSEVPIFKNVYADIGDEQSLEQSISTFSSHAGRIADILREADRDSLVLLDELGAGTDPAEGAALGAAVLEDLLARGCMVVVTTHHNALKLFGAETQGAVNASMEFDPETLRPTYRMIIGRPGRSYGLDMAERIGVPRAVVERARARLGAVELSLDQLLARIEKDTRLCAERLEEVERRLKEAREDRDEAARLLASAKEEARLVKQGAKEEARDVLLQLRKRLSELASLPVQGAAAAEVRKDVEALARRLDTAPDVATTSEVRHDFRPGHRVRIPRLNKTGILLAVRKDGLEVDVEGKVLRLSHFEATPVQEIEPKLSGGGWSADLEQPEGPIDRLNIRGLRVDDAVSELDRFIDRAWLSGFSSVMIIHGLGTGALKSAVSKFLKTHPRVSTVRPGMPQEGGAGVTVAELKK